MRRSPMRCHRSMQRLVNSMFTLSTLVGLSVAQLTQGTIVGNLGFSEIAFPKPLFHGDTLYAETVITDKRESKSRPGEGIVTFAHTGRNQHGDIVATASRKTWCGSGRPRTSLMTLHRHRTGLAVLPRRPPGTFREGCRCSRCGDPRLGGRLRRRGPPAAREALIDTPLDPARTVVRVNPTDTADHQLIWKHWPARPTHRDAGQNRIGASGQRSGTAGGDRAGRNATGCAGRSPRPPAWTTHSR